MPTFNEVVDSLEQRSEREKAERETLIHIARAASLLIPYLDGFIDVNALLPWTTLKRDLKKVKHLL